MKFKGVIKIGAPYLESRDGRVRIVSCIDIAGEERSLWFEVPEEYGQYLCIERSDGFLIGLLYTALNEGYDIECQKPVSEELLYQIRTYLIPSVVKYGKDLYWPKISADMDTSIIANAGAVGTGISCGVDSLHAIASNWNSEYPNHNITHLILYNVGAFWKEGTQIAWQLSQARKFAAEYGFKLIETDSNLHTAFPRVHLLANTYSNAFAIYMLQKLWRYYYLGSVGVDLGGFSLKENNLHDSAYYDLLSLDCYSTASLKIYSDGCAKSRFEKIKFIGDFKPAQKYLDCCIYVGAGSDTGKPNCGKCFKCRRTLVNLDALGLLDKYGQVFDIEYYKKNINEYYSWLLTQKWIPSGDAMIDEAYSILLPRIPTCIKVKDKITRAKYRLGSWWRSIKLAMHSFRIPYLFYRRFIKRYPNWREI